MIINCYAELSKKQFSNKSTAASSPTSSSINWWKSIAKRHWGLLLVVVAVIGGTYTQMKGPFKELKAAYEYFKDYQPVENVFPVSAKEHYLPRDEEMKKMEKNFSEVEKRCRNTNPARLYLTGKPGRGKTQLALGYARKFYKEQWFRHYMLSRVAVVHLDASNLAESYPKVLELLHPGIDTERMTPDKMRAKTEEELKKKDHWLLVVDNVNSSDIKLPMPDVVGRKMRRILLVTSNRSVMQTNFAAEHQLGGMTEQEAIQLLNKTSRHDGKHDEASARALVNFLGLVPLSITRYKSSVH